jgi:phosphoribosylformylglycinamidine synthase
MGAGVGRPRALVVAMPGNNCEYESAYAFERAGAVAEVFVARNLGPRDIELSTRAAAERIRASQILMLPGGFSAGDEPDGSGKFTATFFRNPRVREAVEEFLEARGGLVLGVCNGFQALIKLGLLPHGRITAPDEGSPTLAINRIGRFVSRLVRVAVCDNPSPWLDFARPGDVFAAPVAHAEGRFHAGWDQVLSLAAGRQVATQYVGPDGLPTMDEPYNPNGSVGAIEGITSPDGRILGKMAHIERCGDGLLRNVPGNMDFLAFESGVRHFRR